MRSNTHATASWDWLVEPNAVFKLYSAERRAFYDWQVAEQEWSAATSRVAANGRSKPPQELKNRLDEAAQAYERARQRLHEAWSA